MHYGFVIPGGDVQTLVEVAQEIEFAGWDGVFVADGIYGVDPWVALSAIAMRTTRVRLGPLLTPASRRRPWKLASETATLDQLSHGRVILSVGLGATNTGFEQVGEQTDRKVRAQLMEECLEVVQGFWHGEPFRYEGIHYHVNWDFDWSYQPVQKPGIPIWVVGAWPHKRSVRRALRYNGLLTAHMLPDSSFVSLEPDDVQAIKRFCEDERRNSGVGQTSPFDIVVEGVTPIGNPEQAARQVAAYEQAGATWWIESMWDVPGGLDAVRARIKQGPPCISR